MNAVNSYNDPVLLVYNGVLCDLLNGDALQGSRCKVFVLAS